MTREELFDNLKVASPCRASWEEMDGDDRVRHCKMCDRNVYNLSAMTRVEGEALLMSHTGRLCARFYRRADGTILTSDCPVGVRARRRRRFVGLSTALATSLASVSACGPGQDVDHGGRSRACEP
jgi:hypothetical protein